MKKTISIVTPCYNEEESIRICYDAVRNLFDTELSNYNREHIFCDNASKDMTTDILRDIASKDTNVKVILNARNFGPMRSNFNGVMNASGDAVLLFLPADLQDPPELIPEFVQLWETGNEVVFGIRTLREEPLLMRLMRKVFYRLVSSLSYVDFPIDVGDFQLVDRKVVNAMMLYEDSYPFMRMMTFECGFKSIGIPYTWRSRQDGKSKNRFIHLIDQGLNGLVTFSRVPLRLSLFGGFALALACILYAIVSILITIFSDTASSQPGIPTLIVALFFFTGIQLFFIGMLGEYILSIHGQVRKQPMVIERERINFSVSNKNNRPR
ncbi:MAG: glycosyltransferase [Magnetovibrio sp.]|nr:glycosyltransferase [Magnetovibrio sp.]|tara:strand:+ start:638 stop:1609 length:972 start_codon:yes stop_codon:yes gene_type:complete